jgi:hypothetical protein
MMTSSDFNFVSPKINPRTTYFRKIKNFFTLSQRTLRGAALGLLIGLGLVLALSAA